MAHTTGFFAWRAVIAWRCKLESKTEREMAECLGGEAMRGLSAMHGLATARGIPFFVVYPGEGALRMTDLVASPLHIRAIAEILDWFTPEIDVSTSTILQMLRERKLPVIYFPGYRKFSLDNFRAGDYHLNEQGGMAAATELSDLLAPVLKDLARKSGGRGAGAYSR